ncbi:F0F1 ATP synthase subunit B [Shinella sp. H4-D48]|jgi:F-type H+-transporting ATPase subunit b|uniref:ATP synthase subunit b n=1 Tax=Shinella sedimenti TaxID=2919913 RepID=A0ABT0CSD3_9HYPH|nr:MULTISPECIES: F0F1 ATP synthase subunit B [Shinella]MCJ8151513.1 F0F1 ATP synthase subunit B [Shinella sedimenti]UNK37408.1 F0F1 ATP synthase subunit B [Shinella sp. H4-D48]
MSVTLASAESTPFEIAQAETPADTHETPADAHAAQPAGEVHTETGVAHGGEHASGVFPPFDQTTFASQLLWLAITFGLFYLLMSKVVIPRIGGILETRHDRIAQDLDEASRLKAEADAAIASYEQELAAARAKGNAIASTARDEAKAKADAERAKIEASLQDKIAGAETRIAEIKAKALADVGTIAEETTAAVVEQLIGAKATKAEIASAVKSAAGE